MQLALPLPSPGMYSSDEWAGRELDVVVMRWLLNVVTVCALSVSGLFAATSTASAAPPQALTGLQDAARLVQDSSGVTHIEADSLHDVFFLQGWVHARDRLFQIDVNRRAPSGTLAELFGNAALGGDVQARTVGQRRAAARTWAAAPADMRASLQAYADGVNAFVASHPLPLEYAALGLTSFASWTPVDSLTVGKAFAFALSFNLDIGPTLQLQAYIQAMGPQKGLALFTQDVMRSQPFSNASTVPDASVAAAAVERAAPALDANGVAELNEAADLGRAYLAKVAHSPLFQQALTRDGSEGSNEWAMSGSHTVDGHPLVANDPHLSLGSPSTFYPVGLRAEGMDVEGEGFAGVPGVIIGHNRWITWGATNNPMDVTDTYQEKVVLERDLAERAVDRLPGHARARHPRSREFPLQQRWHARHRDGRRRRTARERTAIPPATNLLDSRRVMPGVVNVLGQSRSAYNSRRAMDDGQIVLICTGPGEAGKLAANLVVFDALRAALSRAEVPEADRQLSPSCWTSSSDTT